MFDAVSMLRGCTPVLAGAVVRELRQLSKNRGRSGAAARTALQELRYKNIKVSNKSTGDADAEILRIARRHRGSAVITNDTALSKRLLGSGTTEVFKLDLSGRLIRAR